MTALTASSQHPGASRRPRAEDAIRSKSSDAGFRGFTLLDLLVTLAILGTLLVLLLPNISNLLHKSRVKSAIADIIHIGSRLEDHLQDYGVLPESLAELDRVTLTDPWGKPYQYLAILGKSKKEIDGKWRKDHFLVPLNSDFDLYSMGRDGKSVAPLTANASRDDIVRANNGDFVGLGSDY